VSANYGPPAAWVNRWRTILSVTGN